MKILSFVTFLSIGLLMVMIINVMPSYGNQGDNSPLIRELVLKQNIM